MLYPWDPQTKPIDNLTNIYDMGWRNELGLGSEGLWDASLLGLINGDSFQWQRPDTSQQRTPASISNYLQNEAIARQVFGLLGNQGSSAGAPVQGNGSSQGFRLGLGGKGATAGTGSTAGFSLGLSGAGGSGLAAGGAFGGTAGTLGTSGAVVGAGTLAADASAFAPLATTAPTAAGVTAGTLAPAATGGTATFSAVGGGAGSWVGNASKWLLNNKSIVSGLLTTAGQAYSQYQKKKAAKNQFNYDNQILDEKRAYVEQERQRMMNSPAAQISPYLMQYITNLLGNRLNTYSQNSGYTLPMDQIMGVLANSTRRS